MSGINYRKVAKISEPKGNFKKAADFYAGAGDLKKAYSLYEKVLSTTDDWNVKRDVRQRLIKLNYPVHSKKIASETNKKTLERRVYATASIISLAGALFFTSLSLSGYATGSLANDTSLMGIVLFVLGLVTFVFFKSREK